MSESWLVVAEIADRTGDHPETVRDACRSKALHAEQRTKGGRWRAQPECVDAWVAGGECPHEGAPVISLAARRAAKRHAG